GGSEARWRSFRVGGERGPQGLDIASGRRLARKLERGAGARHRRAVGLGWRDERQSLLGPGKIASLDVAFGKTRERLGVLTVLLHHLAEQLRRGIDIARGKR